jgi:cytochrome b pre-mRNA-processing protein 3
MLWPFSRFRNLGAPSHRTIEVIYGMIVAQAREPVFYASYNVPDTVNGRLDMLILHLWLVLRRLPPETNGAATSQALFDHFCADMDANLREMGVGDLTVPKRMKKFGEAFYGRSAAYDLAMGEGASALADALSRNVFDGSSPDGARHLAAYVMVAKDRLASADKAALFNGSWSFPQPVMA